MQQQAFMLERPLTKRSAGEYMASAGPLVSNFAHTPLLKRQNPMDNLLTQGIFSILPLRTP
ncbi:hypothetical protein DM806_11930 [Sphingobium lactosutens]|nr:hypothetical protein [Sphingobium lactosutens]